jgi:hypothetical protein
LRVQLPALASADSLRRAAITVTPAVPFDLRLFHRGRPASRVADELRVELDTRALQPKTTYRIRVEHLLRPRLGLPIEVKLEKMLRIGRPDGRPLELRELRAAERQRSLERSLLGRLPAGARCYVAPHGKVALEFSKPLAVLMWSFLLPDSDDARVQSRELARDGSRSLELDLPDGAAVGGRLRVLLPKSQPAGRLPPTQAIDGTRLSRAIERSIDLAWVSLDGSPEPVDPSEPTSNLRVRFQAQPDTEVVASLHTKDNAARVMALDTSWEEDAPFARLPDTSNGAQDIGVRDDARFSTVSELRQGWITIPRSALAEGRYIVVVRAYSRREDTRRREDDLGVYRGMDYREIEIDKTRPVLIDATKATGVSSASASPKATSEPRTPSKSWLRTSVGTPRLLSRVCVETRAPIRKVRLACDSKAAGEVAVRRSIAAASGPTAKQNAKTVVSCASQLRVPPECSITATWSAEAVDAAGNRSKPLVLRNAACETPGKFVS